MDRLAAMARGYPPDLIMVNRSAHDDYEDYRTPEQQVPDKPLDYAWESCITMGKQWSYKPDDTYKSTRELIHLLVDVVAKGGNLLLNIGPAPDGTLPETAVSRLGEIGDWMAVNAEAIHGTRPVAPYKEGNVALTGRGETVYAICLLSENAAPPAAITLSTIRPAPGSKVELLGSREPVAWSVGAGGTVIRLPQAALQPGPLAYALTLKIAVRP